jgi:hypothetical protein
VYTEAESRYLAEARGHLLEAGSAQKWWGVLRESIFGVCPFVPPLVGPGGGLVADPVEKAEFLGRQFDSKQSRVVLDLPATCHSRPALVSFAFRSSDVLRLFSDLDTCEGVGPTGALLCHGLLFTGHA